MNDRLLKKLILKEIHSVLKEADPGDKRRYEVLLNDIGDKLEEAAEMAKSLGKSAEYSDLRTMVVGIDELIRMHEGSDEGSEEDFDEDYDDEGPLFKDEEY